MDDRKYNQIVKHISRIDKTLSSIDKTLALQHMSLDTHIKRTDLLEKKFEPVEQHVQQVRGVGKFIGILALIATIATTYLIFK